MRLSKYRWAATLVSLGMLCYAFAVTLTMPVEGQQQILIQLADVAGSTQTQRAATLGNFALATTLTVRPALGVQLMTAPAQWVVQSNPASGTVASASIAAEALVRHVVNCVGWSADASAAVAAAAGTVIVRDGATGAGTVLQPWAVAHQVAAGAGIQTVVPFSFCGLSLTGTTNTAMTIEFNAGVTGEVQAVWASGINVQ